MSISTHPRHAATPRAVATLGALPRRKAIALLSLFFVPGVGQAKQQLLAPVDLRPVALRVVEQAAQGTGVGEGVAGLGGRHAG